jgi:1-acyl-sn-glycerol-3-phosphate acyltransferase
MTGEPRRDIVLRRLVTIPRVYGLFVVVTVLLPVLAVGALVVDIARAAATRKPWMAVRMIAFAWVYLAMEVVGLAGAFAVWAITLNGRLGGRERYLGRNFGIQKWALGTLFEASRRIFRLTYVVEGTEHLGRGPLVVMMRHASIVDNLLPMMMVTKPSGMYLRYVLKRELLGDPIFDVVGTRIPNHFVDRGGTDTATEVARVRDLARDLGPDEGVIIYPEGTRFTKAKQARILERLQSGDPDFYARAQKLRHVLPPRVGGPQALLEGAPEADVLVVAHTGLGGFAQVGDVWAGAMVGRVVKVKMWRVDAADVPRGRREQVEWVSEHWARIDEWIHNQGIEL